VSATWDLDRTVVSNVSCRQRNSFQPSITTAQEGEEGGECFRNKGQKFRVDLA
jgi:hypothetical protein